MRNLIIAFLLALSFTLSGCATDGYNPLTGQTTQPGTYAYSIRPDGTIDINASTLRGGPDVTIDETSEGDRSISITPSREAVIKELGTLLVR